MVFKLRNCFVMMMFIMKLKFLAKIFRHKIVLEVLLFISIVSIDKI